MKKILVILSIAIVFLVAAVGLLYIFTKKQIATPKPPLIVGGQCDYANNSGTCTIKSLKRLKRKFLGSGYHDRGVETEVAFSFSPLGISNASSSEDSFNVIVNDEIRRYALYPGNTIPCIDQRIISGTCSPGSIAFEFTGEGSHPSEREIAGVIESIDYGKKELLVKEEDATRQHLIPLLNMPLFAWDNATEVELPSFSSGDKITVTGWADPKKNAFQAEEIRNENLNFPVYGSVISVNPSQREMTVENKFQENQNTSIRINPDADILDLTGEDISLNDVRSGDIIGVWGSNDSIYYLRDFSHLQGGVYFYGTIKRKEGQKIFIETDNTKQGQYYMHPRINATIRNTFILDMEKNSGELRDQCGKEMGVKDFNIGDELYFVGNFDSKRDPSVIITSAEGYQLHSPFLGIYISYESSNKELKVADDYCNGNVIGERTLQLNEKSNIIDANGNTMPFFDYTIFPDSMKIWAKQDTTGKIQVETVQNLTYSPSVRKEDYGTLRFSKNRSRFYITLDFGREFDLLFTAHTKIYNEKNVAIDPASLKEGMYIFFEGFEEPRWKSAIILQTVKIVP